jgi:UDP-N-acetylglucosamine--N-acetylmuramyl-(pentapeptide) pyrophosphoryl-undecaprenol N-acetylglucosamine transferase
VLNKTVPEALAALSDRRAVEVRHQVGSADLEQTRVSYACSGVKSWLGAFIDDMADAYSWADLVVCRAGAMTVCELATVGLASILVPFPHAVDDHQTGNARYLADAGAAVVVQQVDLNPSLLCRMLSDFCRARERLVEMAKAARKLAIPDATHRVARRCMEAAGV